MTDNASVMEEIVRSLSFEVVATPHPSQKVVPSTTTKTTPLNIKVKVKKKHDGGLQHGVLATPVKGQDEVPQRIRLVSSDQTIMSFNAVMEDIDFDKSRVQKPDLHNIDNHPDTPSTTEAGQSGATLKNKYLLTKVKDESNKKKDIFGRCKPGGCLDPPFGEDKYSYAPSPQKTQIEDAPDKKRTSSIFSNKLFNKIKKPKTNKVDGKKNESVSNQSISSLYQTGSLQTSNSIITYPSLLNESNDKVTQDRHKSPKTSATKKPTESDNGSLYIVPKKTRASLEKEETKRKSEKNDTNLDSSQELGNIDDVRKLNDDEKVNPSSFNNLEGGAKYLNTDIVDEANYQEKYVLPNAPKVEQYLSDNLVGNALETTHDETRENATSRVKTSLIAAGVASATAGIVATLLVDSKDKNNTSDDILEDKFSGNDNEDNIKVETNKIILNDNGDDNNESAARNITDVKTAYGSNIDHEEQLSTNTIDYYNSNVNKYEGINSEDGKIVFNKDLSKVAQNYVTKGIMDNENELLNEAEKFDPYKLVSQDHVSKNEMLYNNSSDIRQFDLNKAEDFEPNKYISEDFGNMNKIPSDDLSDHGYINNVISSMDTLDKIDNQVSKSHILKDFNTDKYISDDLSKINNIPSHDLSDNGDINNKISSLDTLDKTDNQVSKSNIVKGFATDKHISEDFGNINKITSNDLSDNGYINNVISSLDTLHKIDNQVPKSDIVKDFDHNKYNSDDKSNINKTSSDDLSDNGGINTKEIPSLNTLDTIDNQVSKSDIVKDFVPDKYISKDFGNINRIPSDDLSDHGHINNVISSLDTLDKIDNQVSKSDILKDFDTDRYISDDLSKIHNIPSDDLSDNGDINNKISSLNTLDKIDNQVSKSDIVKDFDLNKYNSDDIRNINKISYDDLSDNGGIDNEEIPSLNTLHKIDNQVSKSDIVKDFDLNKYNSDDIRNINKISSDDLSDNGGIDNEEIPSLNTLDKIDNQVSKSDIVKDFDIDKYVSKDFDNINKITSDDLSDNGHINNIISSLDTLDKIDNQVSKSDIVKDFDLNKYNSDDIRNINKISSADLSDNGGIDNEEIQSLNTSDKIDNQVSKSNIVNDFDPDKYISEDFGNTNKIPSDDFNDNGGIDNITLSLDTLDQIDNQVSKSDIVKEITFPKAVVFTDLLTKVDSESNSEFQPLSTSNTNIGESDNDNQNISIRDNISDKISKYDEDIASVLNGQKDFQGVLEQGNIFHELDETSRNKTQSGLKSEDTFDYKDNMDMKQSINIIDDDGQSNSSNAAIKRNIYSDKLGDKDDLIEKISKHNQLQLESDSERESLKKIHIKTAADGDKQKKQKQSVEQFKTNIDLAFYTYTNKNNELILKSFDSRNPPSRYPQDSVIVTATDLKVPFELKIPFGTEQHLSIQIKDNEILTKILPGTAISSKNNIIRKPQIPKLHKINEHMNSTVKNATKAVKLINKDIVKAQMKDIYGTYENELVPLQKSLTRLKQDVDVLILHQKTIRNNLLSKRLKIQGSKKCVCTKKL